MESEKVPSYGTFEASVVATQSKNIAVNNPLENQ